jgi:transcription initiation factor TFIIIB Brf1 subunit/transcription initiation factor TFIIB
MRVSAEYKTAVLEHVGARPAYLEKKFDLAMKISLNLGHAFLTTQNAIEFIATCEDYGSTVTDSIAIGAVYAAGLLRKGNQRKTQEEVADAAKCSPKRVNHGYKRLEQILGVNFK